MTTDMLHDQAELTDELPREHRDETPEAPEAPEPPVERLEVRRNLPVAAGVAAASALIAVAYLTRALGPGGVLDWLVALVLAALAGVHLVAALDSRTPLLVADPQGVRIRLGGTWRGMPWADLEEIEHLPRRSLRDGRLVLLPRGEADEVAVLDGAAQRQARLSTMIYGAPFAVPLGLTTRVTGAVGGVTETLVRLAGDATTVVEVDPGAVDDVEVEEAELEAPEAGEETVFLETAAEPTAPLVASPTPSPLREPVRAARAEIAHPEADPEETVAWQVFPRVDAEADHEPDHEPAPDDEATGEILASAVEPESEPEPEPVREPVIGPQLAAARERLGLSVDQLADRTRIRPHVIESIEIDDFAPCGGDFYARGHLRTLARIVGIDAAPLVATYDDTCADAPVDPRRIFESDLASRPGGAGRGSRRGPNWSVLVAAVMAVVLVWSVARLVMDGSTHITPATAKVSLSSHTGANPYAAKGSPLPLTLTAAGGGARVVVRDGNGKVVYHGSITFGQTLSFSALAPVRVQTSDGSVTGTFGGTDEGALGATGVAAEKTWTAPSK